jgi:hypothetical protein
VERGDVAVSVAELGCPAEDLVCDAGRGECDAELGARLASEPDVVVQQLDVEPCLAGPVEHERHARLEDRRADRTIGHHLELEVGCREHRVYRSGERKPTIAPSMAGFWSVQATASAPGVTERRA